MNNQFLNLGTAAVLDAANLHVGSYTEIDGQVLVVENIVDDLHVYFRPVTGLELWRYRWSQLSMIGQTLAGTLAVLIIVMLFWLLK